MMENFKIPIYLISGMLLTSCTIVYNQPPQGTQAAVDDSKYIRPAQPSKSSDKWKPKNISEVMAGCQRLQSARDIPIYCETKYYNGITTILVGFYDITTTQQWLPSFADMLGEPFCEFAKQSNRQALVMAFIKSENKANIYSCENNRLSGWFSLDNQDDAKRNDNELKANGQFM